MKHHHTHNSGRTYFSRVRTSLQGNVGMGGWAWLLVVLLAVSFGGQAHALVAYDSGALNFSASNQSIWDTGGGASISANKFLGTEWTNQTMSIDAMLGSATETVPNPLRIAYDLLYEPCKLLYSHDVCVNGQSAQQLVLALGDKPSSISCEWYEAGCLIEAGIRETARLAWDGAWAICKADGFSDYTCKNGQALKLPVAALGAAPPATITIDTRTGAKVDLSTSGKVGIEAGFTLDSGSVDATADFSVKADLPDGLTVGAGTFFNINSSSTFDAGTVATQSPTATAYYYSS
ncbi:MAG: hypothetical protein GY801_13985 [bacterium]|nr:hypothetical protein [bacterium]